METVVRQPGEAHPVPGHFAVVKIASDETDERFCVLEATLAADGGLTSRLHRHHKHVESWFVVDGALEFCSGNETILAPAGSFVLVPPSAPHTFGNGGPGETRIVAFYTPGADGPFHRRAREAQEHGRSGLQGVRHLFDRYDTEPADENVPADVPVRVTAPGEGEHLSVGGGTITILADSAATGGSFAVVDYTAPPGFPGPPPHRHREIVDVFYVLEGELVFEIENERSRRSPGRWWRSRPGRCTRSRTRRTGPRAFSDSSLPAASSSTSATLRRRSATGRSIPRSPRR